MMYRVKAFFTISIISFCFLSFSFYSYGEEASSSNYELAFIKTGSDVMAMAASRNIFTYFVIGDVFSVPVTITATQQDISFSYDDIIPSIVSDIKYEIGEVGAKTHVTGFEIKPQTWQRDNDPYFYWLIFITPPTLIRGFSVSLDGLPDKEIDTTDTSYQYPTDEINDGKHTFYVIPSVTEDTWGPPVDFEIWIDTLPPSISGLTPPPGVLLTDKQIEISCRISDEMSGLDPANLEFVINDQKVSGNYDEEEGLFSYTAFLDDGENVVLVKAEDLTGNQAVKSWSFITDSTPPVCNIVINNDDPITNSAYVVLKMSVEQELSGVKQIYLSNDGIFDTEMVAPLPFSPVIEDWLLKDPDISGKKTVYAKFEDNAGNISLVYSDDIDLIVTVPDTRIVSAPPSLTEKQDATFYYESSRAGSLFSYSLDGAQWSEWQSQDSVSFSSLEIGSHLFRVKAGFDTDGNEEISLDEEDPTPAQWSWTIREETLIERLQRTLFFRRQ